MDARRRQWVPIDANIAFTRTGDNLLKKFGRDGLLVWILLLCAAKRGFNQGEFEYVGEAHGWSKLGIENHVPDFTLKEFFKYTGRIHATRNDRKRARNGLQTIEIRAWNEWNSTVQRQRNADKQSRKRAKNRGDDTNALGVTDSDSDRYRDEIGVTHPAGTPLSQEQNAAKGREMIAQLANKLRPAQ